MAEEQCVAGHQVRLDRLGVDLALRRVRSQHHDQVRLLAGLVRRQHPQTLRLSLRPAFAGFRQTDPNVDAGVPQGQRVRVPLAAEAKDGDVAALDQGQVGVLVVEHLCWHVRLLSVWWLST